MNALSYFAPALFMFTVHIAIDAFRQDVLQRWLAGTVSSGVLDWFVYTVDFLYAMMFGTIIFYSLHFKNSTKHFKQYIYVISTVLGILMIIVMGVLLVDVIRGLIDGSTCTSSST
jgi:branched-subunit amino acid permease